MVSRLRPSFRAGLAVGVILGSALALATGVSAPRPADAAGIDATDCELACVDCQHDARTIAQRRACGAITAGCCAAAGRRPPGTFIDCTCGGTVR